MKKKFLKNQGFTVIEMLISAGIVVFLTVIFLANYHSISFRTELNIDAQKVISNLNLTRSFSLSSKKYNEILSNGGWGVYFSSQDSSKYLIFADIDNDHAYDNGEAEVAKGGKVINLSNKVYIDNINMCENVPCVGTTTATIIFIPPDPTVYINSASSTSSCVDIRLKEKGIPTTKTIRINSLGLSEAID